MAATDPPLNPILVIANNARAWQDYKFFFGLTGTSYRYISLPEHLAFHKSPNEILIVGRPDLHRWEEALADLKAAGVPITYSVDEYESAFML
jgi:hypothetical protein